MKTTLPKAERNTFQQNVLDLIATHNGNNHLLVIPNPLIAFTGSLHNAAFLSHMLF